nr:MAG TPA: hypothetical protein [Caudoviricetes sp.]
MESTFRINKPRRSRYAGGRGHFYKESEGV